MHPFSHVFILWNIRTAFDDSTDFNLLMLCPSSFFFRYGLFLDPSQAGKQLAITNTHTLSIDNWQVGEQIWLHKEMQFACFQRSILQQNWCSNTRKFFSLIFWIFY